MADELEYDLLTELEMVEGESAPEYVNVTARHARLEIKRLREEVARLRYIRSFDNVDMNVLSSHMKELKPLLDEILEALDDFRCDAAWDKRHGDLLWRVTEVRKSWWPEV